ncbi:MAG: hypothetical protein NTV43_15995 [Methylococcales bacterium]|nr:hypothetical protein [Methylococcales bacterium]
MSAISNGNPTVGWLGVAAFAGSMLFVWQGLDFTDMGFWLTGFQQFYTHPDSTFAVCWLTNFIGHWVGLAFGGIVLSYKLGYVAVVTTSAMIAYRLLASQIGNSRLLAAMVLLIVFVTEGYTGNWIDYNNLTALFYLVADALLFFGLVGNRKLLVMLAGVVLGSNVFIRFPNLLGISLVSAIWLQAWVSRWTHRDTLVWSVWFLSGFALGLALIWRLIVLHGHQAIYLVGIHAIFDLATDASSHHPGSGLLKRFISDHVHAFAEAATILLVGSWIANWASKQKNLLATVVIFAFALLLAYIFYVCDDWRWCVPGICYIVLLSIVFLEWRKDSALVLLAFIAGMVLLLVPLGSSNGISNSVFGLWLALPLTLIWLWRSSDLAFSLGFKVSDDRFKWNSHISMEVRGFRLLTITLVLALLFQTLTLAWRHTYLDSKNRHTMTHPIAHPLLLGTHTTAERAKVATELLDALTHFVKPGDELLAYNAIPLVHFLTQTHPWLGDPWPDFVDAKRLAALIRKKEQAGGALPAIVRAKGSTYNNSWPINPQPVATFWHQDEPRQVFAEFGQRHGYVVVWSNEFFEILSTRSSKQEASM